MQEMQNKIEKRKEIQMKFFFFEKEGENMQGTNARTQKYTRELHLELGGDKITYVRVY